MGLLDNLHLEQYNEDERFMSLAIVLASDAAGNTYPNPMVGAVIVKDGDFIGAGYHERAGEAHAEASAIEEALQEGKDLTGATLYVNLEPCCHEGKTPPCCDLIIKSGISKVVIGIEDPFPLVQGKGIDRLLKAGIEVVVGVLPEECYLLNEVFFTNVLENRPFVTLKSAMSLDGKIGTYTGDSKWITNIASRRDGHELRRLNEVMIVGIGTILADDPELSYRDLQPELDESYRLVKKRGRKPKKSKIFEKKQPHLFILDTQCKTPSTSQLFNVPYRQVYILVGEDHDKDQAEKLREVGARIIIAKTELGEDGRSSISLHDTLRIIKEEGYSSVLVEGGSQVVASFVKERLFDKIVTYIGDLIIGGKMAVPAVGGDGFSSIDEALRLDFQSVEVIDNNIKIVAYPRKDDD